MHVSSFENVFLLVTVIQENDCIALFDTILCSIDDKSQYLIEVS